MTDYVVALVVGVLGCGMAVSFGAVTGVSRRGALTWGIARFGRLHPLGWYLLTGFSAVPIPLALYRWACCATTPLIGARGWYEETAATAQQMLAQWWDIRSEHEAISEVMALLATAPNAWDRVRAINVAIAANRAGYLPTPWCAGAVMHASRELQSGYASFDAIASTYLGHRRAWAGLPSDGSGDDAQQRWCASRVEDLQLRDWDGVPYGLCLASCEVGR